VAVFDRQLGREILHPLIPKDTIIPESETHEFVSAGNYSPMAKVRIYQGEGTELHGDVLMVGEFIIEIEPRPEPTPLEIGLTLDRNGLLVAHATDLSTQRQTKCEINYNDSTQLPRQEVERRRKALEETMSQRHQTSANVLDGVPGSGPTPASSQRQGPPGPQPASTGAAPGDPLAAMNPIVHNLVQQATLGFSRIPSDRQPAVMQLVGQITEAARVGDAMQVMQLGLQLQQLLTGMS